MVSKFRLGVMMVLALLPQVMRADDVAKKGMPFVSKGGGYSRGSENSSQTFSTVSGYAARPGNETLSLVTVEWLPIERDPIGNRCKVSGHLQFSNAGVTKNIDWFQGVVAYLAKQPDQELDWSKGIEQTQASYETDFTIDRSGTFEVWFDLRNMQSDRHVEQAYHQSTGIDLIRAVNAVRQLGKEKGLATLEEFLKLSGGENYFGEVHNTVIWIIQLAFESDPSKEKVPFPDVRDRLVQRDTPERQSWPLDPLELSQNLPFKVTGNIVAGKLATNYSKPHLAWAHESGVVCEGLLVPSNDPLTAGQAILSSHKFKSLNEPEQREAAGWIRGQSISMVPDLVEQFRKSNPIKPGDMIDYEADWVALLEYSKQFDITWDQQSENFIVRQK